MTIHYAEIQSDAGPFVFIRLSDRVDQSTHDIAPWARKLSSRYFSDRPVAVHNRDETGRAVLTVFPPQFYSAAAGIGDNLIGLATMTVEDSPLTKTLTYRTHES